MLDVHILQLPETPEHLKSACLESCQRAAEQAGFPVQIHVVQGILGHLGQARQRGYSQGTASYVTHVDDDDSVMDNAFAILKPLLDEGVTAVTTGERHLYPNGKFADFPRNRHHLAVFKRERLEQLPYQRFRILPDTFLLASLNSAHIPECVYNYTVNTQSPCRRLHQQHRQILDREMSQIKAMRARRGG